MATAILDELAAVTGAACVAYASITSVGIAIRSTIDLAVLAAVPSALALTVTSVEAARAVTAAVKGVAAINLTPIPDVACVFARTAAV